MVHFSLDFDETITREDTLSLIIKCSKELTVHSSVWRRLTQKYYTTSSYNRNLYFQSKEEKNILTYCESFRKAEKESVDNINESLCYEGIAKEDLLNTGKTSVKMFPEVNELFKDLIEMNIPINIVSANFSKDIIKGALSNIEGYEKISIYSNDLEFDNENKATGKIIERYLVSNDKLKVMKSLCEKYNDNKIIYIGDGITDVLCMLNATVGIVYMPRKGFIEDCNTFNIKLKQLSQWDSNNMSNENTLYFVMNWTDIIQWWNTHKSLFV